jgi:hypothetical protein
MQGAPRHTLHRIKSPNCDRLHESNARILIAPMPTIRRLNAFLSLSAVVVAGLLLTGCGNGVGVSPATANAAAASDPSSPAPSPTPTPAPSPSPAPSPAPTAPATGSATLSWSVPTQNTNGTPLTDLAGYHIYYGTSPGAWTSTITVLEATETSYVVAGLAKGTYYFAVVAFNAEGTDSPQSNVGSKTI